MPIGKASFLGSPYIGVFVKASDQLIVVPPTLSHHEITLIGRWLDAPVVPVTIGSGDLAGALAAMNSHGIVITEEVEDPDLERLRKYAPVAVLPTRLNALGNNILSNDFGAVVHPGYSSDEIAQIETALGVKATSATIAGEGTVAKTAVATNKGVLVHPASTSHEMEVLRTALQVPVHKTTANFGNPLVGACVVANSRGIIAGERTTPVELVHIEDGLSVYD